ncbi:3-alpha--hydroxysteroid dehydrogenase [Aureobasidium sp. EXF-8845]|nr:3-alpha--hydroxysteroid dehydrogenase [Aureobasidium sp. EXF-8845]KAI4843073.1 3-alpha--hydroxysteroid dehydrogenase [Aureobasidium sp. EXF-8846]
MTAAPKKTLALSPPPTPQTIGGDSTFPGVPTIAAPPSSPRLKDKICIITGCNSALGIGRASAYEFASAGAKALILSDFDISNLSNWKQDIEKLYPGTQVVVQKVDAGDEEDVKAVVKLAVDKWGRLDVFFANAGVGGTMERVYEVGKKEGKSEEEFMRTMKVNALSVFLATKHAANAMMQNKPSPNGSIINTASVAGLRSNAGPTDYSASKAAVISITQTSAYQLAGTSIRCNAICPGIIETGMTAQMYKAARARGSEGKIGQLNPLMRGAVADEVARVALFLATNESSYVNGQAWAVDGGLSAGLPFVPGKLA